MLQLFEYEKWRKWAAKDMSAASKESAGRWSQLLFGILVFNCLEQQKCKIFIFFFLIRYIDINTLVHREWTKGQQIKNKNCKNLGNQKKKGKICFAKQTTNPTKL